MVEQHLLRVRLWSLCKRIGEGAPMGCGPPDSLASRSSSAEPSPPGPNPKFETGLGNRRQRLRHPLTRDTVDPTRLPPVPRGRYAKDLPRRSPSTGWVRPRDG